ncbi:MAG: hypothetical protein PHT58_05470 [Eubacteriales bacterium]|nr:hypothetical protein [Eubacteriales bacterium]
MIRDMHCHILYGVDDGASTREESLRMLDVAAHGGITQIMATPHFRGRWNNRELVHQTFDDLVVEAKQRGIILMLGSEFFIREFDRDNIEYIKNELCFENSNTILLELSSFTSIDDARDVIYPLQRNGMKVIIAHPERYKEIQHRPVLHEEYLIMNCELQLSADCFALPSWSIRRRTAKALFKANAYALVASDAHSAADYERFLVSVKKYGLN